LPSEVSTYTEQLAKIESVPPELRERVLKDFVAVMQKEVDRAPEDIRYRTFIASMGYFPLTRFNIAYLTNAEQEFQEVIRLSPGKQMGYFGLIQVYFATGRFKEAFQYAEKALALDSTNPEAQIFFILAGAYLEKFDAVDEILRAYPALQEYYHLERLVNVYGRAKAYARIIPWYEKLVERNPGREWASVRARLAELYRLAGMKEKARAEALEIQRLDPEEYRDEIQEFLKKL
jgi:tetratricopeptide (TPR) repeat protein